MSTERLTTNEVAQELKHIRALVEQRFDQVDRRLDRGQVVMDRLEEQVGIHAQRLAALDIRAGLVGFLGGAIVTIGTVLLRTA